MIKFSKKSKYGIFYFHHLSPYSVEQLEEKNITKLDSVINDRILKYVGIKMYYNLPYISDFAFEKMIEHFGYDTVDWKKISMHSELPENILLKYKDKIKWDLYLLCKNKKLSNTTWFKLRDFLVTVPEFINICDKREFKFKHYNTDFLDIFCDVEIKKAYFKESDDEISESDDEFWRTDVLDRPLIDWEWVIENMDLTGDREYILERYWDHFGALDIIKWQELSMEFILKKLKKFKKELCEGIKTLSQYQPLSEEFIYKYFDEIDFEKVLVWSKLSIKFLQKYSTLFRANDIVDVLCKYQDLTEKYIEKNMDWLDMKTISRYQNLSYKFIKKYEDKLDLKALSKNENYNKKNTLQIFMNSNNECFIIQRKNPEPESFLETKKISYIEI